MFLLEDFHAKLHFSIETDGTWGNQVVFASVTHALRQDRRAAVVWRMEGTLSRICYPARVRTSLLCRAEMDGWSL